MDINDLRSVLTVVSFGLFIGIVWWAYSGHRKHSFEEAAQLALDDDDLPVSNGSRAANAEK